MKRFSQIYLLKVTLVAALFLSGGSVELAYSANGSDTDLWREKLFIRPKNWIVRVENSGTETSGEVEAAISLYKVEKVTASNNLTFNLDDSESGHSIPFNKPAYAGQLIFSVEIISINTTPRNKSVSFQILQKVKKTGKHNKIRGAKVNFSDPKVGDIEKTKFNYRIP